MNINRYFVNGMYAALFFIFFTQSLLSNPCDFFSSLELAEKSFAESVLREDLFEKLILHWHNEYHSLPGEDRLKIARRINNLKGRTNPPFVVTDLRLQPLECELSFIGEDQQGLSGHAPSFESDGVERGGEWRCTVEDQLLALCIKLINDNRTREAIQLCRNHSDTPKIALVSYAIQIKHEFAGRIMQDLGFNGDTIGESGSTFRREAMLADYERFVKFYCTNQVLCTIQ